jgi:ubiquinone/menaquinone biosynthesis C-methylase UbiE
MVEFLDPVKTINRLRVKSNMVAADFGCGAGGWVIPLSRKLEDGLVYAVDIQDEPISVLRSKIEKEEIANIRIIIADLERERGSGIPDRSCDLVLMTNILFQSDDKKALFKEAKRVLNKEAKLLVVDWLPDTSVGPLEKRVSPSEIEKVAEEFDFELSDEFQAGNYHYGLVFKKQ